MTEWLSTCTHSIYLTKEKKTVEDRFYTSSKTAPGKIKSASKTMQCRNFSKANHGKGVWLKVYTTDMMCQDTEWLGRVTKMNKEMRWKFLELTIFIDNWQKWQKTKMRGRSKKYVLSNNYTKIYYTVFCIFIKN